jgi:hypothetical protein
MKTIKSILFPSIITIAFTSCQKQPEASFTTDKNEYVAGETVRLTNTSINASTYRWTFPDGTTGTAVNYDYVTDPNQSDGKLNFKLEAFSKNGKKVDETSKTVNIKAATGNAVFWQRVGSGYGITVVRLNGLSSNITSEYYSSPDCGTSGNAVFNGLKVGTYNWSASDGTYNWSGTITITKDGCTSVELS